MPRAEVKRRRAPLHQGCFYRARVAQGFVLHGLFMQRDAVGALQALRRFRGENRLPRRSPRRDNAAVGDLAGASRHRRREGENIMQMRVPLCAAMAVIGVATADAGESTGYEQPGYWKCQTIQSSPTATLYVSDIFERKADPAEVQSAFQQMLAATYGLKDQVSCSMAYKSTPGIFEKMKADDQRWFQQIR
jgi:hypothetical protein